ncbi:hypothetical protein [Prochlorococcus marinus]|uniref:hypothetical protein n=1 Tax=Prochlorococcus marinus TaxID=1219 RepID=UPI0007B3D376|nr:hypothetical protein [Prochlorococcus marinus]KZR78091.1 hypothetical protein PMIT1320_00173 [Prochlorococcus marinus str. MIT 1320]
MSDGLFVGPAFNTDDINVQFDQIDMIELESLDNLEPPISKHDLLTGFNQDMFFDVKDMANMMNEIKDMAMSQANYGANGDGAHFHTWESDEAKRGDNWSMWSGDGFETHYTHNGEPTTKAEYDAAKKAAQAGKDHPTGTNSSNSSDENDEEKGNDIIAPRDWPDGRGHWFINGLVPEQLVSNRIEEIDVSAHQMPMFIGVQQATTHLF